MGLVQHNHVVQAFATQGADPALHERILPWRAWCDDHFLDTQVLERAAELVPVDAVAVADQVTRRRARRSSGRDSEKLLRISELETWFCGR